MNEINNVTKQLNLSKSLLSKEPLTFEHSFAPSSSKIGNGANGVSGAEVSCGSTHVPKLNYFSLLFNG